MSCSLPPEIVDLIIDHLHDEPATLKACCLVSKSWIQRTRIHLFVDIKFHPLGRRVSRWRETFPDRTNSPAHHTRTLSICHPQLITAADVHTLLTFCGVLQLTVDTDLWHDQRVSLVPLRGFSPVLRSLHLTLTSLPDSEIFGLVCSLPLLEDLGLVSRNRRRANGGWNIPSTSPRLTGSLELRMIEGIGPTTRRLLDLPNGLHFTKIAVPWLSGGDILSTMYLVSRCSDTLESLDIANHLSNAPELSLFDLSKVAKLHELVFRCKTSDVRWIITVLQTAESKNIKHISLELYRYALWDAVHQGWLDLDHLLVQLWTSHSPRLKVTYELIKGSRESRDHVAKLLPELMRRGIVDLVGYPSVPQAFPGFTTLV